MLRARARASVTRARPHVRHKSARIHPWAAGMACRPPTDQSTKSNFVGAQGEYTPNLKFWYPQVDTPPAVLPVFRVIDHVGRVVSDEVPELDRETAVACMQTSNAHKALELLQLSPTCMQIRTRTRRSNSCSYRPHRRGCARGA